MAPSSAGLDTARRLVMQVLRRERTVQEEPYLVEDDLLCFAAGALSEGDPGWLLRRLLDESLDYDARMTILTQLSGAPRLAALPFLRAEHPEHDIWQLIPSRPSSHDSRPSDRADSELASLLARLDNEEPRERDRAAEALRDLCVDPELSVASFRQTADELLAAALREADPQALESMLNCLAEMARSPDAERIDSVDWSPLAALLEDLEDTQCLRHAVEALGATGHERHRAAISRVARHATDEVRESVADALHHIDARSLASRSIDPEGQSV